MSRSPCSLSASVLALARRVVYGPGYLRAREGAFRRSNGICQFCGNRRAAEAHHWALRYPTDAEVTANDLVALCRLCHWMATLRRLLDRMGETGMWFVLATAPFPVPQPPGSTSIPGSGRLAPRRGPRSCGAPKQSSPDLRTLVERCHLTLLAGCLACQRFERLDAVPHFRLHGWAGTVADLRRRLCCCRCRSRARWVLLGGWPAGGTAASGGGHGRGVERRAAGDGR